MEELVEVLLENGKSTGKYINKLKAHKQGICHGISTIALIDNKGRLLIQKRSSTKKDEPNKWDLSCAGHIDINETPKDAAIREMHEELNIILDKKDLVLLDTYLNKIKLNEETYINHYTYLYIVKKEIDINEIIMNQEEVTSFRFVSKKEYNELLNNNQMVKAVKHCNKLLEYIK